MSLQTRREFSKLALTVLPAAGLINLMPSLRGSAAPVASGAVAKPNSTVRGVRIGMNVPYNYGGTTMSGEETLQRTLQLGISTLELRSQPIEAFMGAPGAVTAAAGGRGSLVLPGASPTQTAAALTASTAELSASVTAARSALAMASLKAPASPVEITDKGAALAAAEMKLAQARSEWLAKVQSSPDKLNAEQLMAVLQANGGPAPAGGRGGAGGRGASSDELKRWRASPPMAKVAEFRKIYEDAGVFTDIVKYDGIPTMSDAELDYCFVLAKAMGARSISCEMAIDQAKRVGAVAEKHRMLVGWHNHQAMTSDVWEAAFAEGKYNGANVDIGHYVAGNNKSPLDFIEKYHDRVTHLHVKDRGFNLGPAVAFGKGDVPIGEILRTVRDKGWQIPAVIEFEYQVPAGSDRMAEIAKAIQYCREALA